MVWNCLPYEVIQMTVQVKRKILAKIQQLENDIEILKQARMEAVLNGYASASISSSGGSKSYTRLSPDQITSLINELTRELEQYQNLVAFNERVPMKTTVVIWS